MKKHGTLLLSGALALAIGAAVILGNGWAASQVLAASIDVDTPAKATGTVTGTVAGSGTGSGSGTGTGSGTGIGYTEGQQGQAYVSGPSEGGGETGAGSATVLKTLDSGETVFVRYAADENGTWASVAYPSGEVENLEGDAAAAAIERFGGPKRDLPARYVEGEPVSGDISPEIAQNTAIKSLTGKYALKREIIGKFDVSAKFYSVYEDIDSAVWRVSLYPANISDFAEIGCYTAILNAETGEAIQLLSTADGKG
jgi:hypothetical protein